MTGHPLLNQALQSFQQLVHNLPRPNYAPLIREAGVQGFTDCLYADTTIPPIKEYPRAIFRELGRLNPKNVPPHWRPALKAWRQFHATAAFLRSLSEDSESPKEKRPDPLVERLDSERAGILLTGEGAQTELGHFLFDIAVTTEAGAFLAGHAPDLRRHQIHEILDKLAVNPELLFWLAQNRPAVKEPCYTLASRANGLFGGLASTELRNIHRLKELVDNADLSPMGSAAALSLFPKCSTAQMDRWISNLRVAPRLRYEVVRWTRHTWYGGRWLTLRAEVGMPPDRGRWWFHWCRDLEPDPAHWCLGEVAALWCAELCIDLALPRLPATVLERLWQNMSSDEHALEATTLLRWSQTRRWPG